MACSRQSAVPAWMLLVSLALPCAASVAAELTISAAPGALVRWSVPGTKRCGMHARSWESLQETCYYPIDLEQKPGRIRVSRQGQGRTEFAHISVESHDYGTEEVELSDIPQAHPSSEDLRRNAREGVLLNKAFGRKEGPATFTLPLGPPAKPLPAGKSFGVKRIYNGKPAAQLHTGIDYPTPVGSPLLAVADGTVVVAQDLFFPGNAVIIDHGNGLFSMYFHLAEITVKTGQQLVKGERVGTVGSTGRSTGPHLFFGVRWHNSRIDPQFLLKDPARIPAIGP